MGTKESPGTKTFAVTGHVVNTGLVEMPLGSTLREIVYHVAGGVTTDNGKPAGDGFKAAQIGGPSGGCLTREHLDLPIDFDSLKKVGAMVGSGGLVIMNNETCMVSVARFFMQFTQSESCGKCVLCREGTKQMLCPSRRHNRRAGHGGDPGNPRRPRQDGAEGLALRPRQVGAQPGPLHAAPFPRRVRGPREAQILSRRASARASLSSRSTRSFAGAARSAQKNVR